jgi:hypothetical protein
MAVSAASRRGTSSTSDAGLTLVRRSGNPLGYFARFQR